MNTKLNQKGFTLIELLIVIVIIGILAGIIIMVLDPARQRNRAKDSVIVATMTKIATEIRAYQNSDVSGNAALPDCLTLISNLKNATAAGGCSAAGDYDALINVTGVTNATGGPVSIQYKGYTSTGDFCLGSAAVNVETNRTHFRMQTNMASMGTPTKTLPAGSGSICP